MKEININVKTMHNVEVWLKRANEADFKMVKEVHNTTHTDLKAYLRNCTINSDDTTKYMGVGGYIKSQNSGTYENKDGMLLHANNGDDYYGFISGPHGSDPSGNYYKRWTGVFTAPGAVTVDGYIELGVKSSTDGDHFTYKYATADIGELEMATNDVLKIHWKVSLSGGDYLPTYLRDRLTAAPNDNHMGARGLFDANTLGGINEKDGIYIETGAGVYSMITKAHPTDPAGIYYSRWQGIFTAPSLVSFTGGVYLGVDYDEVTDVFEKNWDNKSLSAWDMNLGDILKVNWKVSFS